ncbi:MAG TPA: hypothetical protein VFV99_03380 [Kofleriaceae bacterium]|nr:hypothetical protein [Kofleriaceae bacterium]
MREDESPELDADDRALVAKLKDLPSEGTEPNWQELEAAIRAEVGDQAPRPWWRNWRWIVPVWALATTAVIALVVMCSNHEPERQAVVPAVFDAGVPSAPEQAEPTTTTALWLDGEAVQLDDVPGSALDELDGEARAALTPDDDVSNGILPATDYGWLDTLDDEAMVAAEDWLNRKRT